MRHYEYELTDSLKDARAYFARLRKKPPITPIKYAAFIAAPYYRPRDAYARGFEIAIAANTCPRGCLIYPAPSGKCPRCVDASPKFVWECRKSQADATLCGYCTCIACTCPTSQKRPR